MSKVEDLIRELCPEGVEQKPLGELGTFTRGRRFVKDDIVNEGVPCIHYGEMYTHYGVSAKETKSFLKKAVAAKLRVAHPNDIIIVAAGETVEDIGNGTAWLGSENVVIHDACYIFSHNLEPKYVSYFLRTNNFHSQIKRHISSGKISSISAKGLEKAKIPVPPIEVQKEIVHILDKFTQLEAELEAELEARRKQYEYYRSQLLTFDDSRERVRWLALGDIFDMKNGYTPSKNNREYWDNGDVAWFRMDDIRENGRVLGDSIQHITAKAVKGGRLFPANSIILSTSATIGEHALITKDFLANQRFTVLTPKNEYSEKIDMKFVFYYGFLIDEWCKKNTNMSGFASVDMNGLRKFKIPLPELDKQKSIVKILDKFDKLVHDISEGLPAELSARREQYNYYRTKLLTFQEAAA